LQRREQQVLYAHASPWTLDVPVAPDVTTLLYQTLAPAWTDVREADEIVADIVASPGLPTAELAADEPERWAALVAHTWPFGAGVRSRSWAGGPVPSNRFD
jgi:hypothetical protein